MFMGQSEFDQFDKIIGLLGTPDEEQWPGIKKLPNYGKIVLKPKPSQLRSKFQVRCLFGDLSLQGGVVTHGKTVLKPKHSQLRSKFQECIVCLWAWTCRGRHSSRASCA